ncbi:MAG: hypothetical protein Greene041662_267 [Candidatus Peregrinibacteria bacterium Greene0416_62]|nr:MAG: hypothetical protein Greene041662_267 [Candidatus Peregrinibacteria bacterium Greene0416_62]TSC99821.1 MAG: hypothetical protein Greene101449_512 [Candidatus Peregrinibacteria bacterium Greene1014_49]
MPEPILLLVEGKNSYENLSIFTMNGLVWRSVQIQTCCVRPSEHPPVPCECMRPPKRVDAILKTLRDAGILLMLPEGELDELATFDDEPLPDAVTQNPTTGDT